ncbi:N-acetylmuramoyl-L-alanine amidase [Clostridium weizhouense]|uniref:N-acetylmuramoyl-L-alanine amidase n=1 Tax=Clostridium weizhouense TaxID=2859781 RepID=A0ABS7ASY8_9CLOT|nr:N-acetylmuramoyl-L-alanine amidase [Clostridium weizhouense]MBW6410776.1 N-acetylmuramoyl-L-alanine amidase [Clostridium weizhouense]
MNINKKIMSFFLALAIIFSIVPATDVQADANGNAVFADINIISNTKLTAEQAKKWAKSKGATTTFIDLAEVYWEYAELHGGVNPGIAYVQSAKETGYGKFGGVLDDTYHNPCGMKTSAGGGDTDPNAHMKFDSWDEGVQAHLDHLALYAGAKEYPRQDTYDPRHFVSIKGKASTVNSLGGKWAPSSTYGEEVNKLYNDMLAYSGLESKYEEVSKPSNPGPAPSVPDATVPIENSNNNTANITSSIGWKYEGGYWYYYRSDGSKATGWIKPDSNWYYLYSNGAMATGWLKSGSSWYYFQSFGGMKLGWLKDGATWYFLQGDGSMVNGFKLIDSKKYFFDVSGAMRVGWFEISGNWHYFNTDGSMLTGWIRPDSNWYYLYSNGTMSTGWVKLSDKWYYFNSNGSMATGWVTTGQYTYYLYPSSGEMAKATVINGWEIGPDGSRGKRVSGGSSRLIVIDPGHNFGGDDGAYATHNRVTYSERDLNMQLAVKLKAKLEARGYEVMMTRNETDRETLSVTQSLTKRVDMANNFNADFFVSLHHNSADAVAATGVETYYSSKPQDSEFGGAFSDYKLSVSKKMATNITNSIVNNTGAVNRGAKDGNLFVCRNTKMPAVLVESGFITNPEEAANCADSSYQNKITDGIADSIANAI